MLKFTMSQAARKSHLWRRSAARLYTDLRDERIRGDTRVHLMQAHAAMIKAASAVKNDDKDPDVVGK